MVAGRLALHNQVTDQPDMTSNLQCTLQSPEVIATSVGDLAKSVHIFQQSALDIAEYASLRVLAFRAWETVGEREMELSAYDSLDAEIKAHKRLLTFRLQMTELLEKLYSDLDIVEQIFQLCANDGVQNVNWSDHVTIAFIIMWLVVTSVRELDSAISDKRKNKANYAFAKAIKYDVHVLGELMDERESNVLKISSDTKFIETTSRLLETFDTIYQKLLAVLSKEVLSKRQHVIAQPTQTSDISPLSDLLGLAVDQFSWLRELEHVFTPPDVTTVISPTPYAFSDPGSTKVGTDEANTAADLGASDVDSVIRQPIKVLQSRESSPQGRAFHLTLGVSNTSLRRWNNFCQTHGGSNIPWTVESTAVGPQWALMWTSVIKVEGKEFHGEASNKQRSKNEAAAAALRHYGQGGF